MLAYPQTETNASPVPVKIIGLGNAGVHLSDCLAMAAPEGAEIIAMNSDAQSLASTVALRKSELGPRATRGLGAGGDPEIGYEAGRESLEEIRFAVEGAAVVVLLVGLGGGTGSGAAALVAQTAREAGACVLVLATVPFSFEGRRRASQAMEAEAALGKFTHAILRFENDRMADLSAPRGGIGETFAASDATLVGCVESLLGILSGKGPMPVSLGSLLAALSVGSPSAFFGRGTSKSENRAHEALEMALQSPLLDRGRLLESCASVLVQVSGPPNLSFSETAAIMRELSKHIADDARMFLGVSCSEDPTPPLSVTIFGVESGEAATGATKARARVKPAPSEPSKPRQTTPPSPSLESPSRPAPEPRPTESSPSKPETSEEWEAPLPEPPGRLFADEEETVASRSQESRPPGQTSKKPASPKAKQETLQFESVARGRFEKSEPTIVGGEDLDVPTFLRLRGKSGQ